MAHIIAVITSPVGGTSGGQHGAQPAHADSLGFTVKGRHSRIYGLIEHPCVNLCDSLPPLFPALHCGKLQPPGHLTPLLGRSSDTGA